MYLLFFGKYIIITLVNHLNVNKYNNLQIISDESESCYFKNFDT